MAVRSIKAVQGAQIGLLVASWHGRNRGSKRHLTAIDFGAESCYYGST